MAFGAIVHPSSQISAIAEHHIVALISPTVVSDIRTFVRKCELSLDSDGNWSIFLLRKEYWFLASQKTSTY